MKKNHFNATQIIEDLFKRKEKDILYPITMDLKKPNLGEIGLEINLLKKE